MNKDLQKEKIQEIYNEITRLTEELSKELIVGGYDKETPVAVVYKATWPDEKILRCTVENLPQTMKENNINKTALILVGNFLGDDYERSELYNPEFTHEFRKGIE